MLNALLETFSCVYSETMIIIISFFQKLIKGGVELISGGDDYSVLESNFTESLLQVHTSLYLAFVISFFALVCDLYNWDSLVLERVLQTMLL